MSTKTLVGDLAEQRVLVPRQTLGVLSLTSVPMLQACSQRVDFKFRRNFGERHRFWCRLQGSASFSSLLSWTEVGLKSMFSCLNESIADVGGELLVQFAFPIQTFAAGNRSVLARTTFWPRSHCLISAPLLRKEK